jgi:hypothetical protein
LHLTRRANVLLSPASEALWKSVSLVASQLETAIGGQWADRQYAKLSVHSP